jgi:hypothetical protein
MTVGDLFPGSHEDEARLKDLTITEQDGRNTLSVVYVKRPQSGFVKHFPAGMIMVGREREL